MKWKKSISLINQSSIVFNKCKLNLFTKLSIFISLFLILFTSSAYAAALANQSTTPNISGATGSYQYYTLSVPAGASDLKVSTSSSNGDADLYVAFNREPTTSDFDYRSWSYTSNELIQEATPLIGTYYIGIYAYRTYSNLSLTVSYTVGGTTNSGTISFATTLTNVAENIAGGNVVVSVTRTGGSNGAVSVDYSTIDTGTAIGGSDYQTTVGSIVFAPGEIQKSIIIPIINDNLVEGTENFNVLLSNVTGGALLDTNTHTVLIIDDEQLAGTVLSVSLVKAIKLLQFSWTVVPGAINYKVYENAGGTGYVPISATLDSTTTTFDYEIPVHKFDWLNTKYMVQSCVNTSCTLSGELSVVDLMVSRIGYFKASNTGASDLFGFSVALSGDGSTLAVGAFREDSSSTGINSIPNELATNSGAVYVFVRSGTSWVQQSYIKSSNTGADDRFGLSVTLSGDGSTLAVGADKEDSSTTGINSTPNELASAAGAVYVYKRSGVIWSQQAYIKASNADANDSFGYSVTLSGDGNSLAVGAAFENSDSTGINSVPNELALNSGAVYVFTRSATNWTQQAYVKASNSDVSDGFGYSIAFSADGSTLAVGARFEDSGSTGINSIPDELVTDAGATYVFTLSVTGWIQQAYIKASNTGANDGFGNSVALSGNGNTLAVGAFGEDSSSTGINSISNEIASDAGAVYVFTRTATNWSQQAYVKASNTDTGDFFGRSVSLSDDGNTLAVGANGEASSTIGINSVSDELAINAGAVYVFTKSFSAWVQHSYVKSSNTGMSDYFGTSVSLSADGNAMSVGAYGEDSSSTGVNSTSDELSNSAGSVYMY